jgi:chemotaxis protein MotB
MSDDKNNPPIIIKKIKKSEGHHGGAWKVAYADFVTAMMALFIVLWVLSQDTATKESIVRYFKDPIGFSAKNKNILQGNTKDLTEINEDKATRKAMELDRLRKMGEKIISELGGDPDFADLKNQIKIEFSKEGLKIEILDSVDGAFFRIGTATLNPRAEELIKKIGNNLARLPNKIVIEGHTDARPYSGNGTGYTNFELSAERANSARRALVSGKLSGSQIDEVRGYADRKLRDKKNPFSTVNRRISIIVKYTQ